MSEPSAWLQVWPDGMSSICNHGGNKGSAPLYTLEAVPA